jgi:hypothetical protein
MNEPQLLGNGEAADLMKTFADDPTTENATAIFSRIIPRHIEHVVEWYTGLVKTGVDPVKALHQTMKSVERAFYLANPCIDASTPVPDEEHY